MSSVRDCVLREEGEEKLRPVPSGGIIHFRHHRSRCLEAAARSPQARMSPGYGRQHSLSTGFEMGLQEGFPDRGLWCLVNSCGSRRWWFFLDLPDRSDPLAAAQFLVCGEQGAAEVEGSCDDDPVGRVAVHFRAEAPRQLGDL